MTKVDLDQGTALSCPPNHFKQGKVHFFDRSCMETQTSLYWGNASTGNKNQNKIKP